MKTRIMLILFLIVLTTSTTAFASEHTKVIPSLGTLIFPSDIEVLPYQLNPTSKNVSAGSTTLLAHDNKTLRSINIAFLLLPNIDRDGIKANLDYLTTTFNSINASLVKEHDDIRILSSTPMQSSALDNEQLPVTSVKMLISGAVVCMDFYILDSPDGLISMLTTNAHGDINYWKPILAKMIADIKR